MVKHIEREALIPGVDVTELCEWLKDPNMYAQYHEEYNHNKRITISEWNITENVAERDVVFLMPLRAPGILKRTIGGCRCAASAAITIEAQVDVAINCTAEAFPWLWALHSLIEKVMGSQCKHTADGLIEFWQRECKLKEAAEREAAQKQDAARPDPKGEEAQQESSKQEFLSPASSVTDDVRSITSTGSVYYDADDDLHMPNAEQHTPKKKEGKRWKNLFCCFGHCTKQEEEEVPTLSHLLD
ncbi:hypothetical protein WJX75_007607 [Coccomyxa subellipsoidea]|uniref:VASt domain-containing protein n=1 Tax=Coccomyxa subellipsoidea TaxID=248742 RepID=A0ABR2YVW4_9CHLO